MSKSGNGQGGRVLMLTSNFPRWEGDSTTTFILDLAKDLQSLDWKVDILAPHAKGCRREEHMDGVHVRRFRYCIPESLQTLCYGGGALINIRKNPIKRLLIVPFLLAEITSTISCLKSVKYDILHTHWILPQGFSGVVAAMLMNVPHIVTIHGGDIFGLRGRVNQLAKRYVLESANAVTVNSSVTETAARQITDKIRCLKRIPMGVAIPSAERVSNGKAAELKREFGSDAQLLIFVGRLVEEKGVGDLIEAARLLLHQGRKVKLLILGEGQDRAKFEQQVKSYGLTDSVIFHGWVASDKVGDYIRAADIFVGPSKTGVDGWVEGQGLTFLEAMANRTAVIATRCGGIVDSVFDGETGLLVDQQQPEQIAAAVIKLLDHDDLCHRLSAAAATMVIEKFSRQASSSEFAALYSTMRSRL